MDGAVLSAPYDPANAARDRAARGSNAARTEVMNPPPRRVEPATPLPSIRAPVQKVTPPYSDKLAHDRRTTQKAATGLIRGAFALRGAVGILTGLPTLFLLSTAFRIVFLGFVAYVFVGGVCALVAALRAWIARKTGWLLLLDGILGGVGGALALFLTLVSPQSLFPLAAAWAIGTGILQAGAAFQLRKLITSYWLLALAGATSILYGLVFLLVFASLISPDLIFERYLAFIRLTGGYEVISGVLLAIFAGSARDRAGSGDLQSG